MVRPEQELLLEASLSLPFSLQNLEAVVGLKIGIDIETKGQVKAHEMTFLSWGPNSGLLTPSPTLFFLYLLGWDKLVWKQPRHNPRKLGRAQVSGQRPGGYLAAACFVP